MSISRRELIGGVAGVAFLPSFANFKLDDTDAKLKKIADKYSELYGSPAIIISVAKQGKTIHSYAAGFRDLVRPNEVQITDQIAIGAVSKVVCAYIAGQIVREDELLQWKTEFQSLCPDLSSGLNSPAAKATLEQLITHTAGLIYAVPNQDSVAKLSTPVEGREVLCKLTLAAPGVVPPATRMTYSTASNLIAQMLEKVSNKTYEQLIAQYINKGLGLTSIRLGMDAYDEKASLVPRGHYLDKATRQMTGYGQYSAWGASMRYQCDANIAITGKPTELAQLFSIIGGYGKDVPVQVLGDAHSTPFELSTYTRAGFAESPLGLFHYGSTGLGDWCSAYVLDKTKTAVFTYVNCNYQEGGFKATELISELNELFGK